MTGERRSIRVAGFEFGQPGAYFVTICAQERRSLFGAVADGRVALSPLGEIAERCWTAVPAHARTAEIDAFVVMPNHVHGILFITPQERLDQDNVPGREVFAVPRAGSLSTIVRSFKAAVSREARLCCFHSGAAVWQRNYFERVIRHERELQRFRAYIESNPARWEDDEENPGRRTRRG